MNLTWVLKGCEKNYHNNKRKFQERLCSGSPCYLELGSNYYFNSYLKPQVDSLLVVKPSVKTNLKQINWSLKKRFKKQVCRPALAVFPELFNCPVSLSKNREVRKKMSLWAVAEVPDNVNAFFSPPFCRFENNWYSFHLPGRKKNRRSFCAVRSSWNGS